MNQDPRIIWDYGHACFRFILPDKSKGEKGLKIPYKTGDLEVILDLSRPWEFAKEKSTFQSDFAINFTRETLPSIKWEDLLKFHKEIEDVDVFVGPMNYMRGGGPCNVEVEVPKLKWKDIELPPYPWRQPKGEMGAFI